MLYPNRLAGKNCRPADWDCFALPRVGRWTLSAVCSGVIQAHSSGQHSQGQASLEFLIQPGWQNSGPHHWQTLWEMRLGGAAKRIVQQDWMIPDRDTWVRTIEQTILQAAHPVIVLAHSVGCMATVFALERAKVAAVVLVAPADTERPGAPEPLQSFSPIPMQRLTAPALVVASDDDPYCSLARARAFAQAWKADLEVIPGGGHINGESGFGPWPEGWRMIGQWMERHDLAWPNSEDMRA